MNIDDLDISIFLTFLESESNFLTNCDVAKKIYKPKNKHELIKHTTKLTYRLNKWVKNNLFDITKVKNINHYSINIKNITYGDSTLKVLDEEIQTGNALILELTDNSYIIQFISDKVKNNF